MLFLSEDDNDEVQLLPVSIDRSSDSPEDQSGDDAVFGVLAAIMVAAGAESVYGEGKFIPPPRRSQTDMMSMSRKD
jgi:hypothetical protein